ncbi:MAG: flavodoxin family protein [Anaerolineae bacterium]|jgi:multimeric flavodoxin WrbA
MTQVLGVVGSPRKKGNTEILVSRILDGAAAEGAGTETLSLRKLKIRECNGCHTCWKGRRCSKRDDMNDAYPLISESDAIVFGTPVYWYGPTALLKAFIDRFVYFNCPENRGKVRGKRAVIAVPYEDEGPEAAELVVAFFERTLAYLEMNLAGQVLAPGVGPKGAILEHEEILIEAYELGRRLALDDPAPTP